MGEEGVCGGGEEDSTHINLYYLVHHLSSVTLTRCHCVLMVSVAVIWVVVVSVIVVRWGCCW